MKNFKVLVVVLAIGTLGFTSCSKDDDGDSSAICYECVTDVQTVTVCPDADGMISEGGQTMSYEDFKDLIELTGGSCSQK